MSDSFLNRTPYPTSIGRFHGFRLFFVVSHHNHGFPFVYSLMYSITEIFVSLSNPLKGSSRKRMSRSANTARTMDTLRLMPPLNRFTVYSCCLPNRFDLNGPLWFRFLRFAANNTYVGYGAKVSHKRSS